MDVGAGEFDAVRGQGAEHPIEIGSHLTARGEADGGLETFALDEIGTPVAGPETDGMAVKLPEDPFGDLDRGQTTGGRV